MGKKYGSVCVIGAASAFVGKRGTDFASGADQMSEAGSFYYPCSVD